MTYSEAVPTIWLISIHHHVVEKRRKENLTKLNENYEHKISAR